MSWSTHEESGPVCMLPQSCPRTESTTARLISTRLALCFSSSWCHSTLDQRGHRYSSLSARLSRHPLSLLPLPSLAAPCPSPPPPRALRPLLNKRQTLLYRLPRAHLRRQQQLQHQRHQSASPRRLSRSSPGRLTLRPRSLWSVARAAAPQPLR